MFNRNKKHFSIKAKHVSENVGELLLYGTIGQDWFSDEDNRAETVINKLAELSEKHERINVRINSLGGYVHEGLAIANYVRNSSTEIHTYLDGVAASMGAIIFLASPKGRAHAAKNSMLMLHSAWSMEMGNRFDFTAAAKSLKVHDRTLAGFVADKTGLSKNDVLERWFNGADHWLEAEEAEEMGLVDHIEDTEANIDTDQLPSDLAQQVMNRQYKFNSTPKKMNVEKQTVLGWIKEAFGLPTKEEQEQLVRDQQLADAEQEIDKMQATFNNLTASNEAQATRIAELEAENAELMAKVAKLEALPGDDAATAAPSATGEKGFIDQVMAVKMKYNY